MNLKYKTLFSIEVLHDYYSDKRCQDFEILPTAATALVLKGQGMLSKTIGNKLMVLLRVDETAKPLIDFGIAGKLSFFMKLRNPRFNNFTNLDYLPSEPKKYYFSNANQSKVGTTLYLSSKIEVYNSVNNYSIGNLAANGSDTVYEAIKPNSSVSPKALTDKNYWMSRGKVQYANPNDLIEVSPYVYQFPVISNTNFTINVFGLNATTGVFDVQVLDTENLSFSSPQTTIVVRLEKLPKGKYKIDVNGETRYVYVDSDAIYNNVFGIIEIVNYLPASNAFSLFNASGLAKSPVYTINFANRSVIWKYIARSNDVTAVSDSRPLPDKLLFTTLPDNQFVSEKPVPISEKPLTTLSIESTALGNISPVANPGTERLGTIEMDGNAYYSAELHLNY